ncbi:MAG: hypothetical protein CL885_03765, partial [Dehalococcoidia bacterium]|nr:hypothetical protein [Dehalococcoidia bacterium]
ALTQLRAKMNQYPKGSAESEQVRAAINNVYSMALQVMAESEEYGSFPTLLPDGGIDYIDGSDRYLARVFVAETDKKGNPIEFGIRDLGTGLQTDETIPSEVLKNLFGEKGYADFRRELTKANKYRDKQAERKAKRDNKQAAAG